MAPYVARSQSERWHGVRKGEGRNNERVIIGPVDIRVRTVVVGVVHVIAS